MEEENEDEMVMDNIEELLNDEMKVVSYKWLSLSLSLHVNKATQLLEHYVNTKGNDLDVVYFIGGKSKDGSKFKFRLVKKDNLEKAKETFECVTTCHIYSIQKSCIKNADTLYASDRDVVKQNLCQINKFSAISCGNLADLGETYEKRTGRDHAPVMNVVNDSDISKGSSSTEEVKKVPSADISASSAKSTSSANNAQGKSKLKKETSTKAFFGKATTKKQVDTPKEEINLEKKEDKPKVDGKSESSKQFSPKKSPAKKGIADAFAKGKKKEKSKDVESKNSDKEVIDVEIPPKKSPSKKGITDAFAKGKKKEKSREVENKDVEKEVMDVEISPNKSPSKKGISDAFAKSKKKEKSNEEENKNLEEEELMDVEMIEEDPKEDDKKNVTEPVGIDSSEEEEEVNNNKKEQKKSKDVVSEKSEERGEKRKKKEKRKAIIDSSSEEDDFENFLSKSKDPNYKSPEKKKTKTKKEPVLLSEDEDVIQPTPEPADKKKKRRKVDKDETKKQKENIKESDPKVRPREKGPEIVRKPGEKRRGRRTVLKSKQFLDEDGFMVTKKVYESESFSEESDSEISEEKLKTLAPEKKKEVEKKKIIVDLEKKAKAHQTKPKTQASLMNFFSKPKK